jgi:hypothetical protein
MNASIVVPALVLGGLAFVACGRSPAVPPSQPQHQHAMGQQDLAAAATPAEVVNLTGRERFAWTQPADSIAGHSFAVYVDGTRQELRDASCQPPVSGHAECSAPLPALSSGRHTLEIISWTTSNGELMESPKSAPMTVELSAGPAAISKNR